MARADLMQFAVLQFVEVNVAVLRSHEKPDALGRSPGHPPNSSRVVKSCVSAAPETNGAAVVAAMNWRRFMSKSRHEEIDLPVARESEAKSSPWRPEDRFCCLIGELAVVDD